VLLELMLCVLINFFFIFSSQLCVFFSIPILIYKYFKGNFLFVSQIEIVLEFWQDFHCHVLSSRPFQLHHKSFQDLTNFRLFKVAFASLLAVVTLHIVKAKKRGNGIGSAPSLWSFDIFLFLNSLLGEKKMRLIYNVNHKPQAFWSFGSC
jgi:hypothetical protein